LVVVIAISLQSGRLGTVSRVLTAIIVILLLTSSSILALAASGAISGDALVSRYQSLLSFDNLAQSDLSFEGRSEQSKTAWMTFLSHPILGVGVTHVFISSYYSQLYGWVTSYSMDSPVATIAVFGIFGTLIIVSFMIGVVRYIIRSYATSVPDFVQSYLSLGISAVVSSIPLLYITDDRGFGLFVILLTLCSTSPHMYATDDITAGDAT